MEVFAVALSYSRTIDLEFNKAANLQIDSTMGEMLIDDFIEELIIELEVVFKISINRSSIVDLDSSTAKKFSRHLIVHLHSTVSGKVEEQLFQDAPSVGIFVKNFVARLVEEKATCRLQINRPVLDQCLFVETCVPSPESNLVKDTSNTNGSETIEDTKVRDNFQRSDRLNSRQTCFVDTGVYTRNRLFRLLGSKKFGKPSSATLRIASANQFPFPQSFRNEIFYSPEIGSNIAIIKPPKRKAIGGNQRHKVRQYKMF